MNAGGVNGVDGFQTRKFDRDHGARQFVNEFSERGVFLGRAADDGEGPDGVLAVIDGIDAQNGKLVRQAVISQVIAEWAFRQGFARDYFPRDTEIGFGGYREAVF